ncbi:MAG: hypothetical protein E7181_05675 [Erysipelotrichaceae bacterium]|nr:hypothetical protein [Erysipelotrichaceae bacterium]
MKASIKLFILLLTVTGLTACNNSPASSSSSTIEPSSAEPSSSTTPISSSEDPYAKRIKSLDFSVVDITDFHYRTEDPDYAELKPIEDYYQPEKLKLYYLDEIDDVYYLPLSSFVTTINDELASGHTATMEENGDTSIWTVKKGEEVVYRLSLNGDSQTMAIDGELDSSFLKSIPDGRNGEHDLATFTHEYLTDYPNTTKTYSFKEYGFDVFKVDGKYCYPFALLGLGLSLVIERNFLINTYEGELYEYGSYDQLSETKFIIEEESQQYVDAIYYIQDGFINQYKDPVTNKTNQPHTLTEFNKKLFYFLMDNFYGMASQKGIRSMSDYFDNFDYAEDLTSDEGGKRMKAYYKGLQMLNDLHTSYGPTTYFDEKAEGGSYHYEQTFYKDRFDLKVYLEGERKAAIAMYNEIYGTKVKKEGMRYSGDGKYGYFSFDSFDTYHYFEEDPIPEEVLIEDTFHRFIKNLVEAKEKGVKRIIIDETTNGGGSVSIMGKLLALLSKDGKSEMFLRSDDNGSILKTTTKLDLNNDGVTDQNDCFGNDFEFYLLTSNFSFSCGNAFPFYADHYGLATIMGQRSGGGECCVFEYNYPSGQNIRYSSPYHLGYLDEKTKKYVGDEFGADPKYNASGDLYSLYDVDFIGQYLDTANPITA